MIHRKDRQKYYISIEDVKVGDTVRIIYNDRFTERMKAFADCTGVVIDVFPDINGVKLDIDEGFYVWHIDWIERTL